MELLGCSQATKIVAFIVAVVLSEVIRQQVELEARQKQWAAQASTKTGGVIRLSSGSCGADRRPQNVL